MDRETLIDLFSELGPVTVRHMFSGFGVAADGIFFSLVLRGSIYLRVDEQTRAPFETEGSEPFIYSTKSKTVTVGSYWKLPDRLYDDPEELADWARAAIGAARRAAAAKNSRTRARTDAGASKSKRPAKKRTARKTSI